EPRNTTIHRCSNLFGALGLCSWCHLQGIHTHGAIKAEPPATHVTWKTPVLEVRGRDVVWRRGARNGEASYAWRKHRSPTGAEPWV
ncbi:MAG: hypothetical protein ACOC9T_01910, partial [Myxococcota bacterium]